jgi:pimeloyl-ACP methyl ester carboxylesterase
MTLRPFQRSHYADVPAKPRIPHAYDCAEVHDVHVSSRVMGKVRVHVRTLGSGPPLLLVHGLMTSSYSFRYVLEPLAKHFRVIVVDMPGSGRSDKPLSPYFSAHHFGIFLGELQSELGIRGCAVMGNSLGGFISMHLALHDPDAISRLVVNHAPGIPDARYVALQALLSQSIVRNVFRRFVQHDVRKWIFRNVHYYDETLKSIEELDEYGQPLATYEGMECFLKMLRETVNPTGFDDFVKKLEKRSLLVPTLFVYARQDPLVPPRVGEALHRLAPGSQLEWIDGTSHFTHVDSPHRMVATVLPFLLPRRESGIAMRDELR